MDDFDDDLAVSIIAAVYPSFIQWRSYIHNATGNRLITGIRNFPNRFYGRIGGRRIYINVSNDNGDFFKTNAYLPNLPFLLDGAFEPLKIPDAGEISDSDVLPFEFSFYRSYPPSIDGDNNTLPTMKSLFGFEFSSYISFWYGVAPDAPNYYDAYGHLPITAIIDAFYQGDEHSAITTSGVIPLGFIFDPLADILAPLELRLVREMRDGRWGYVFQFRSDEYDRFIEDTYVYEIFYYTDYYPPGDSSNDDDHPL